MALKRELEKLALVLALGAAAWTMAGCKPDAAVKNPAMIGRGVKDPTPPPGHEPEAPGAEGANGEASAPVRGSGEITGTIFFKGTAPVKTIDTSMDPACGLGGSGKLPTEQVVAKNGKLANVFVYLKSGPPEAMQAGAAGSAPVILDQRNCQYVPHVIGVAAGGSVEFRNSDPTMHNVHTQPNDAGNQAIDLSEGPRGQPQVKQFAKPEGMMPVRCNNHPWMNAFINVSATPYFAVSDAQGNFALRGLPPGDYVVGALQEKLGEKTMQVTVPANGSGKIEFSFAQ